MKKRSTFSFGKEEKLKSKKLVETLFQDGKAFSVFPYRVVYLAAPRQNPEASPVQAGFSVPSRNFPLAVDRNRIKRLSREAYRLQKQLLTEHFKEKQQSLSLFLIYTAKKIQPYDTVHRKISVILNRLIIESGA